MFGASIARCGQWIHHEVLLSGVVTTSCMIGLHSGNDAVIVVVSMLFEFKFLKGVAVSVAWSGASSHCIELRSDGKDTVAVHAALVRW